MANTNSKSIDAILPFQLDTADIRGRVARLDSTLVETLSQHDYPDVVSGMLAEAVALTALIGPTIKLRWKLSLQIRGNGPIRIIATDYYGPKDDGQPARIRAYASVDYDALQDLPGTGFGQIGKGMFAILIDQGPDMTPYQGVTPLAGGSLAACAETYFAQSEQIPTKFKIAVAKSTTSGSKTEWRAGGIMLQHMPKASPLMAKDMPSEAEDLLSANDLIPDGLEDDWYRVNSHLDTADELELLGPVITEEKLLTRLFHEDNPRIFDKQPIEFGCTCGEDKVRNTLSIYSVKDIQSMTNEAGRVTADCQFCGAHYDMDPETVGKDAKAS
jgi:molecular chaperone Hsp33